MYPKIIKNRKEYEEALSEYDDLLDLDPDPGTEEADKLELLSHLIGEYEEKEFPIDLPDPIEAIKFRMEQQNLRQKDLAPFFGSASKVSEVLNGKRLLSKNMIRALHENLQISAEVLMSSKGTGIPDISSVNWNSFPLKYMYDKGWFKNAPETWAKSKDMAEELVKPLWQNYVALCTAPPLARKTRTIRTERNSDIYSLTAWALRVVDRAKDLKLQNPYSSIDDDFMMELACLSFRDDGPGLVAEFLDSHGICLIVEPRLERTYLDGAAMMLKDGTPVLALTLRYERTDKFWHTLMHEVAHLRLHLCSGSDPFFDDLDQEVDIDDQEREADQLAEDILVPKEIWCGIPELKYVSIGQIESIATRIKRNPSIIAGQIQHKMQNYTKFGKYVSRWSVKEFFL